MRSECEVVVDTTNSSVEESGEEMTYRSAETSENGSGTSRRITKDIQDFHLKVITLLVCVNALRHV